MPATPALDPDEVVCPKCGANPGEVCTQPNGDRARTVHLVRRRAADAGDVGDAHAAKLPQGSTRSKPAGSAAFDSDTARAAATKSAQERRRRRAEAEAAIEAKREEAQRRKVEEEAERLARDAVRFEADRALLKRQTLDAARKAATRLIESLDGLRVVELDEDGKAVTETVEEWNKAGDRMIHRERPVTRGAYDPDRVERLAKVAASTLNALRLEEGKPTGIHRNEGNGSTADQLGDAGVEELLRFASEHLPRGGD